MVGSAEPIARWSILSTIANKTNLKIVIQPENSLILQVKEIIVTKATCPNSSEL
jgi:hypothetical protein